MKARNWVILIAALVLSFAKLAAQNIYANQAYINDRLIVDGYTITGVTNTLTTGSGTSVDLATTSAIESYVAAYVGSDTSGTRYTYNNGVATPDTAVSTTESIIVGFKSSNSATQFNPTRFEVGTDSTAFLIIQIYHCSETSGGSYGSTGTGALVEYNDGVTGYTQLGKIGSFYLSGPGFVSYTDLKDEIITSYVGSKNEVILLTVTASTGSNIWYSMDWQEIN